MLLLKIRNGLELTWDSLDGQERALVLYAVGWLVVMLLAGAARRSREQLRRDILEELGSGAGSRD